MKTMPRMGPGWSRGSRGLAEAVWLWVAGVLAAGPASAAGQSSAQPPDADRESPRIGCFRGRPLPSCKSFWLVEMQGFEPLAQSTRNVRYSDGLAVPVETFESTLEWNVGHIVNVTPAWAFGGTLSVGSQGGSGIFTGVKLRARRWISPDWSLELSGGLLESGAQYPSARGVTADLRINVRDQGAFFVRWDRVRVSVQSWPDDSYFDPGGHQQAVSLGAAAGSVPALIGTGALGLGYVILLALFLSDSN